VPAIQFQSVSKRYILHHQRPQSFQELLVNTVRRRNGEREEFWALRDVSFEVGQGESFGIVGLNGSGKSTVLKLLSHIVQPTAGQVRVDGRVAALIELGAGFHPDLTGRENVYLLGSIMGLGSKQMDQRLEAIVGFAELEQFIDTPVKHYSSGMYMRLGFATAINVDADIFLMDEVLAVGDQRFQEKCLQAIESFKHRGLTVVIVSHDLSLVERFCPHSLLLQHGQVMSYGRTQDVLDSYLTAPHG
jgi:ABC-type polysaccharide/polyol phosphate transport system ATPase subunit